MLIEVPYKYNYKDKLSLWCYILNKLLNCNTEVRTMVLYNMTININPITCNEYNSVVCEYKKLNL